MRYLETKTAILLVSMSIAFVVVLVGYAIGGAMGEMISVPGNMGWLYLQVFFISANKDDNWVHVPFEVRYVCGFVFYTGVVSGVLLLIRTVYLDLKVVRRET